MNHRLYLFDLLRILEYLEANFRAPFHPEGLARYVRYSSWHCRRIFQQYTGESITKKLSRLRLEEGKKELRRGKTVAETALSVGFSSREGFSKAFSAAYGISPGQYARGEETKERYLEAYEYRMTPKQWQGVNPTSDGLWEFSYYDKRANVFRQMRWNNRSRFFEAPYRIPDVEDPAYYCQNRCEGYGLHPGREVNAVRSFICPKSGVLEYFISLGRQSGLHDGSNPCSVRIYHNSKPILPEDGPVVLSDRQPIFLQGTCRVKTGDRIRIVLDAMGHIGRDGVMLYRQRMGYLEIIDET